MESQENESPIESLKQHLNQPDGGAAIRTRGELQASVTDMPTDWEHRHTQEDERPMTKKKKKFASKLLLGSVIFFGVAVVVATFVFTRGTNVISARNVDIIVSGPTALDAGDVLDLEIAIINKNSTTLEATDLLIEFPSGTRAGDDVATELPRVRESLGNIGPGGRVEKTVSATVFGEEGEGKDIIVSVEYRVAGSNAIFVKEKLFTFIVEHAPLGILVDAPDEVSAGQDVEFVIEVVSNSQDALHNILLAVDYPFGFNFVSASPAPDNNERVWDLGDIEKSGKRRITLRGTIDGQDGEARTFRFRAGIESVSRENEIETPFLEISRTLSIARPFIDIGLLLNGSRATEVITPRDRDVRADVTWVNNLPEQLTDVVIEATLSGDMVDKSSVSVNRGFYSSSNNTITWSGSTYDALGVLDAGERGQASFSFRPRDLGEGSRIDPEIRIALSVRGRRPGGSGSRDVTNAIAERVVKVASDVSFSAHALYHTGPFENTGPLPPEADVPTTYTVVWQVHNSSNDVSNAQVTATLPSYVEWVGAIEPGNEDVSFNNIGGSILWNIGTIPAGAGYGESPAEVAFQVRLLPSISHVGSYPILVNQASLSGIDTFTAAPVSVLVPSINTRLSSDSGFNEDEGRVVSGS